MRSRRRQYGASPYIWEFINLTTPSAIDMTNKHFHRIRTKREPNYEELELEKPNPFSSGPFPLLNFPNELIMVIAEKLDTADLNSLLRANRHLSSLLAPQLDAYAIAEDKHDTLWETKLVWAVDNSHTHLVQRLLLLPGTSTNVNREQTLIDWTPLHVAAARTNRAILRLLLKSGTEVDGKSLDASLSVAYAVKYSSIKIVEILLEYGVDAFMNPSRTERVRSALYQRYGYHYNRGASYGLVSLLVSKGVWRKWITLPPGEKGFIHRVVINGDLPVLKLIITTGEDIAAYDGRGEMKKAVEQAGQVPAYEETIVYLLERWPEGMELPELPDWFTAKHGKDLRSFRESAGIETVPVNLLVL